jgi:hypothetical protein
MLGLKKHGPILIKHVGVGPSSHPFLKGWYLNLWRLERWWRARWLKPLGIMHYLHRVPNLLICPSRPLLLNLDVMLAPAHPKNEIEKLPQRGGGPTRPAVLPASPPVRPVLSTGQTGDGLCPCMWLIWPSCSFLKHFFLMSRCLLNSRRWKSRIFARIELQGLVSHILGKLRLCNFFNHIHDVGAIAANLFVVLR